MKRVLLCLAIIMMISGCSGGEALYQIEPPPDSILQANGVSLSENERWIAADAKVTEHSLAVYDEKTAPIAPFEDGVYTSYSAWKQAVKASGGEVLKGQLKRYGEDFFAANVLYCGVDASSAGMGYRVEGVSVEEADSGKTLKLYVSYSSKAVMNHLSDYFFFVEINAAEAPVSEVVIEKYCRD